MKKLCSLILCLLLLPILSVRAELPLVVDYAALMDSKENAALSAKAEEIQARYDLDVVILTTTGLPGNATPRSYAEGFLRTNYSADGILFLLDMESMSWYISTAGSAGTLLRDEELDQIEDTVISHFTGRQYYQGFDAFLTLLPELLDEPEESIGGVLAASATLGALMAGLILGMMIWSMNTKKPQHSASDYTVQGSWNLRTHQDLFLYSNLVRRAKPKDHSSGSAAHRSSSGGSRSGRGGKF